MFKSSGHAKHTTRMPSVLTLLQIQNVQIRKLPHNLQLLTYYSMVNQLQNSHFPNYEAEVSTKWFTQSQHNINI